MKKLLLFCLCLVLVIISCSKDDDPFPEIPQALVQLNISLDDSRFNNLNYISGYHEFKKEDLEQLGLGTALGYGGILVIYSILASDPSNPYAAYDLLCTYEKNTCVQTQPGGRRAICPACKSEYDITSGIGNCIAGPNKGKELIKYKIVRKRYSLRVTN